MKMQIELPREQVTAFCSRWQITEMSLFGSVLRDDFQPSSDVDVLVSFHPDARPTLFDMARMQAELQQIIGRRVDLVSRRGIMSSRNPVRRKNILDSAKVVYGA